MKCKYCNAEVAQNARFCTTCGKDLSIFDKCVNCGELIERNESICPYCGTEQPHEEQFEQDRSRSKKWLWLVLIASVALIIGGGYWFFHNDGALLGKNVDNSTVEVDAADTTAIEIDIHSTEGITSRIYDIYINGFKMGEDEAVNKYFSEELRTLYKEIDEIDTNRDDKGFWEGNIWDGGQDGNPTDVEVVNVEKSSSTVAVSDVEISYHRGEYHSANKFSIILVFENSNWYIDDNLTLDMKNRMKEYINRMREYNNEDANNKDYSTFFVDKIFKGGGNGYGNGIEMTISFLDNNQCLCESDWYRAYSSPKTYKGTYSVDGEKVVVRCKVDDIDYEFDFNIRDGGSIISFSHSDPEMEGSIRNDFMSLELQNR